MRGFGRIDQAERAVLPHLRAFADDALSRAAGAPLIGGNQVRLLKDAKENYPAWLKAIRAAKRHVHFESYIIHEDAIGEDFAAALIEKAREAVRVRLLYDWMGGFGKTSRRFWRDLRSGGVEVRCYNPPRIDSPLGWLSRDHRKMLAITARSVSSRAYAWGASGPEIPPGTWSPGATQELRSEAAQWGRSSGRLSRCGPRWVKAFQNRRPLPLQPEKLVFASWPASRPAPGCFA